MTDEPKFCKDCKHFKAAGAVYVMGYGFGWSDGCNQPPERDLIHGRKTPADPGRMRSERGACKPEALLWEEKPPEPPPAPVEPAFIGYAPAVSPNEIIRTEPAARWWEFWK